MDPVTEHDWVINAIKYLYKNNVINLVCTRESGISSIVQQQFKGVNIYLFNRDRFYTQNPEELSEISSFLGSKKTIVWLTSHYQDGTTPMKIWSYIASGKDKNITLVIKTATLRDEFTRENYYPEEGKFVGGIIAASKTTKKDLIKAFNLPPDKIHVSYMGVNLTIFDFNKYDIVKDIRKEWNFEPEDIIIGVVGSLVPRKGHKMIIDAFSQVYKDFDRAKLAIVGRGELEEELKQMCKNLGERVRFLGYHTQVASLMKMFDILILASDREGGIPRVITEAMAMKTAVISPDLGAIYELVRDGVNGYLIEHSNSDIISEKLHLLLSSPPLLSEMKTNALKSIKEFDRELWLGKLEDSFSIIWNQVYKI